VPGKTVAKPPKKSQSEERNYVMKKAMGKMMIDGDVCKIPKRER
jgi:hypothetical protein